MDSKLENIFVDDACLSPEELVAYAANQLSGKALHRAERHLLSCELCADAAEGMRQQADEKRFKKNTDELNRNIDRRAGQQSKTSDSYFNLQKIAAAVTLLLIAGGIGYYINSLRNNEQLYSQHFEPYKKPADSVTSQLPVSAPSAFNEIPEDQTFKRKNAKGTESLSKEEEEEPAKAIKDIPAEDMAMSKTEDETKAATDLNTLSTPGAAATAKQEQSDNTLNESREVAVTEIALEKKSGKKTRALTSAPPATGQAAESISALSKTSPLSMPREIVALYDSGKYEMSFKEAEQFLKKNPEDAEALFYSGISALSLHKEKLAVARLESCIKTGSSAWVNEASWYLALTKIRQDKTTEARTLLGKIADGNSPRKAEAASLLKDLDGK